MLHTDSGLFKNSFGTERMRELFSEESYVERFMEVEAALARAEADAGVVPEEAAEEITATASIGTIDLADVERKVEEINLFTMSIIETWRDEIGEAGEYIHWGATSQDIGDTTLVLLVRDALAHLRGELTAAGDALADLAEEHADTAMIGRTHHVHAIPTTFGLKVATWLDELERGLDRLDEAQDRLETVEFFGAVGTLASLGEVGIEVQERMADELDLGVPNTAWHASRDRIAELLDALATVAGTLARIARQVLVLGREEIGELREHVPEGKVGSSTMPHKKNPIRSEKAVGLAAMIRGNAATMSEALEAFDERDSGLWYTEFGTVPSSFQYADRAARNVREMLEDLVVRPERMAENLDYHDGLVTSEAVMMALADRVGRQAAHDLVYDVAMEAIGSEHTFRECLREDDRVTDHLSAEELEAVTDPTAYTGVASTLAERTVEARED